MAIKGNGYSVHGQEARPSRPRLGQNFSVG